jgi:GTP-binding protein YchF
MLSATGRSATAHRLGKGKEAFAMRIGIVGFPQSGKTTVFNALTGAHGDTSGYHPGVQVALGVVEVPDERLAALADLFSSEKSLPATLEFEDIGGVFTHLTGGERSGAAIAALREVDGILMVLRCFESPFVAEILGEVNPRREYATMTQELLLADLEVVEKRLAAIEHDILRSTADRDELQRERDLLERCRTALDQEEGLQSLPFNEAELKALRSYSFLTMKPVLCLLNIGEEQIASPAEEPAGLGAPTVAMSAELEMELMELEEDERAAFVADAGLAHMAAGDVIAACYKLLGLISFFTYVSAELRAWSVVAGTDARSAAGKIHSDMEKGFIRAEVVAFDELRELGSLKEAKAHGKLRMEGKGYQVQDGDIITFHFSR